MPLPGSAPCWQGVVDPSYIVYSVSETSSTLAWQAPATCCAGVVLFRDTKVVGGFARQPFLQAVTGWTWLLEAPSMQGHQPRMFDLLNLSAPCTQLDTVPTRSDVKASVWKMGGIPKLPFHFRFHRETLTNALNVLSFLKIPRLLATYYLLRPACYILTTNYLLLQ